MRAKFNASATSGPTAPHLLPNRKLESVFDQLLVPSIAPCPIGKLLEELDPASADNLRTALALSFRELPNVKVLRSLLTEARFTTSVETISAHRKGDCRCSTI